MARTDSQGGFRLRACVAFLTLLALSCTAKKHELSRGEGFDFFKNPESNQACLQTNLSQWELTGAFLHRMLTCASNRSTDGGETLPATQNLLRQLDAAKLQKLIDFALTPDPTGTTHEARYPYLIALSMMLDRGLNDAQKAGLDLSSERLGELQGFLLSLDPNRLQKQLSTWSQSGHLDELLAQLGIFLQALSDDSLSALSREVLEGGHFGPHFLKVSAAVLSQNDLMNSLDSALSADVVRAPDAASQKAMLETWRQPLSVGTAAPAVASTVKPDAAPTTFAKHLDGFSKGLSDDEIQRLSRFLTSFSDAYRNLPGSERNSVSLRLAKGLEQSLDEQQNPVQWLLSMAQDLSTMPASDLNNISDTLGKLLQPDFSSTMDGLRLKVWSSRMHEKLIDLLNKGGEVPGCSKLTVTGIRDLPARDFKAIHGLLRLMSEPNASCGQLPPFSAALETWSQVVVGPDRACEAPCVRLNAVKNDPSVTENYWAADYQEADAGMIQHLVTTTLQQARLASERDHYFLRNLGVAKTAVTPEQIQVLLDRWNTKPAQTLPELAQWDVQLTQVEPFRSLFVEDALEKMLSLKIAELQSLTEQFHGLLPEQGNDLEQSANQRAVRVFAGAYSSGPLEQALRYKLPATLEGQDDLLNDRVIPWPANLKKTFSEQRGLFSHTLASFKFADAVFRNPNLDSTVDGAAIPQSGLGSTTRFVAFDTAAQTSLVLPDSDPDLILPRQSVRMPESIDDHSAWGLWNKPLESGSIGGKDLPPEQAQTYKEFYPQFVAAISDPARWEDLTGPNEPQWIQNSAGIDSTFFEVQPYTPAQARLLTLYYLRHYHKVPNAFPQQKEISTGDIKLGFFSAASLVKNMDLDFTLFVKLFPESFGTGATVEELGQNALTIADDGKVLAPIQITPVLRVGLLLPKYPALGAQNNFKVLSSLNLLTVTEAQAQKIYVQPLVGIGKNNCLNKKGVVTPCAIELVNQDRAAAVTSYKNFVADVVAQHYCPLVNSDAFGPSKLWSQRLGLTLAQADTCKTTRLIPAPVAEDIRFPVWLSKRILNDVFTLGRQAKIKPGLAQLPAALHFYKQKTATEWVRSAVGNWSALNAASQARRQFYVFSFWAGQPDLVGSYIDQWERTVDPLSWGEFTLALGQYDSTGQPHDVIYELFAMVIEVQKRNAAAGQSLLRTMLDTFDQLADRPDFSEAAGHLLSNYTLADNYDFTSRTLPPAALLFDDFDWNQPGLRLTKFFAQNEMLKTGAGLGKLFSPSDFTRVIQQFRASSQLLGTADQRSDLFARFLRETLDLGLLTDASSQTLSQKWNQILQVWRYTDFGQDFSGSWDLMLAGLSAPLKTADGRPAASGAEIINQALAVFLRQGTGLWVLHQDSGAVAEQSFWAKLGLNFVHAVQAEPLGARALSRFFADPHLGFLKGGIWIRGLNEATTRHNMAEALTSLVAVSENYWRDALVESSQLLGRLSKALGYMTARLVWKDDPEHNAYRRFVEQLYLVSSEETLRNDQIALLNSWLRKDDESPARDSTLAAGEK